MKFTKMHGLGNDYVYVNAFVEQISDPAHLAIRVSDRHRGVGSDGLILIARSDQADVRMEMYNADGSRGMMCGNGIRCVAKYAIDYGLVSGPQVRVETDSGIKTADCRSTNGRVSQIRIDMGEPSLDPKRLPASVPLDRIVDHPLRIGDAMFTLTCVSMGNPHAVIFVERFDDIDLNRIGPTIERSSLFPQRINVHVARVDSRDRITMHTWERGSGITQACGTGACAVLVAGAVTGRCDRRITATLPGGNLEVEWLDDLRVYMTGPAEEVFTGDWPE